MTDMLRGRIYRAHLSHIGEDKFFLVVSNNRRNRAFEQVLAAWLTTTPRFAWKSTRRFVRRALDKNGEVHLMIFSAVSDGQFSA
jgi:mRNA-degrading endonuclease toxin of MazEF toxin-antitoxin module